MRATEYFPDILASRICYGLRRQGDTLPTMGDRILPLSPEICVLIYGFENVNAKLEEWRSKGERTLHLSGGLPNPMTMAVQFGFQKRTDLREKTFDTYTMGDVQRNIEDGQSLPIFFDYPGTVRRSVELTGEERFRKLYGHGLSDYLQMTIEQSRAINMKDAFPLDWELMTLVAGKPKLLSRTTWLTKYGYSAGHGASLVYCGYPFEDEDIKVSFVVGDRGPGTTAGNLMLIGMSKGADELEQKFELAYKDATKKEPAGRITSQFVNSTMDTILKLEGILAPYTPEQLRELVFAVTTNVHDSVVDKIGTFFDFEGEDMFVNISGKKLGNQ